MLTAAAAAPIRTADPRGWARSSAGEHCFHTAGVTGSIPVPPTKFASNRKRKALWQSPRAFFLCRLSLFVPAHASASPRWRKKDNQPACFVRVALAPNRGHSPRYVQLTVAQRKESCRHNVAAAWVATHATPQQALNANGAGITPASVGAVGGNSYRSVTYKHASAPVELGTLSAPPRVGASTVRVVTTDCCA